MTKKYKYPFIPKEYYAPTMFACKIIRETGQFNRAINTASKHYRVDKAELERHVRARQSAGQRGKKRGTMKWFAVALCVCSDRGGIDYYKEESASYCVKKGLSADNVKDRIHEKDDLSEHGNYHIIDRVIECDSEESATALVKKWSDERTNRYMTHLP